MASNSSLLPIKVVFPSEGDYSNPDPSRGDTHIFGDGVTMEMRREFNAKLDAVEAYFAASFQRDPGVPAVAVVTLRKEAIAKSHRPLALFNEETCPVIGANKAGELYIRATPQGLANARAQMLRDTKQMTANISTLEEITPFTERQALQASGIAEDDVTELAEEALRLRLFNFRQDETNARAIAALRELAEQLELEVEELSYAEGLHVFRVKPAAPDKQVTDLKTARSEPRSESEARANAPAKAKLSRAALVSLAGFQGTQSVGPFPKYNLVRTQSHIHGGLTAQQFPRPEPGRTYGVVGIIDSGTDPNNPLLQSWVVGRLEHHPRAYQDNDHGSFVAGLIANGRALNHNDPRFPTASCKIVDVVAFDSSGMADEDALLFAIDEGIAKFPNVKVWNLSLALPEPTCSDSEFSIFGTALDERTRRHGVLFVVAAGNYNVKPYRDWPTSPRVDDADRICPPADALLALTVGSSAHRDSPSSRVSMESPSPFSRRGPGAGYIMKPEISHWGGNCDAEGGYVQMGILSLDSHQHMVENIGTSFATPLASAVAGASYHAFNTGPTLPSDRPTPALIKALMVHSALLRNAPMLYPIYSQYMGMGVPGDVADLVGCTQSAATLILKIPVTPTPQWSKDPFPMPSCLQKSGALQGEVLMTLLYEPPIDKDFGIEYCRLNVDASLGTMHPNTDKYEKQIHNYPRWDNSDGYWEKNLLEHGYKWAPLKFYYRRFKHGPANRIWRLRLSQLNRSQFAMTEPQDVTLIITIRAADPKAKVYDELMQAIENLNWINQDLAVRAQNRLRV